MLDQLLPNTNLHFSLEEVGITLDFASKEGLNAVPANWIDHLLELGFVRNDGQVFDMPVYVLTDAGLFFLNYYHYKGRV